MKKRKMMVAIATISMAAIAFTACGKEDDKKGSEDATVFPKTLTSKGYEVKNFQMYVGSSEGGIQIETKDLHPRNFIGKINEGEKSRQDEIFYFLNSSEMKFDMTDEILEYKFENDIFYTWSNNEWDKDGYGSRERMYSVYACSKIITLNKHDENDNSTYSLEKVLSEAGITSLSELKNPTDTIMWCNGEYVWK